MLRKTQSDINKINNLLKQNSKNITIFINAFFRKTLFEYLELGKIMTSVKNESINIETWYKACTQCPRKCGVNRYERVGICGETADLKIAWAGLHFGEEPPITCKGGAGAVFLTGCNLQCKFCQNFQVSQNSLGKVITENEFTEICLRLQNAGAENINIITGVHHSFLLAKYLNHAKNKGLNLPIVWNSSSYESPAIIRMLSNVVDIWLADIKTFDIKIAIENFNAPDYPEVAQKAIKTMCELSCLIFDKKQNRNSKLTSGVIVRHLALPGNLSDSRKILKWFAKNLKDKALFSLMNQYTPIKKSCNKIKSFENRPLNKNEDKTLREVLSELEINDGFYQELEPDYSWLPDFTKVQTFASNLSKPIWHYTCGFV